jgi:signal transduction histidine kinase
VINDQPATVLAALPARRFLLGPWPWRALVHLLTTPVIGVGLWVPVGILVLPWLAALSEVRGPEPVSYPAVAGLVLLGCAVLAAGLPLVALPLADLERRRLRLVDTRGIGGGHRAVLVPGLLRRLRTRYTEAATWRETGYAVLLASLLPLGAIAVLGIGVLPLALAVSPLLAGDGPMVIGAATVTAPADAVGFAVLGVVLLPAVPYLMGAAAGAHGALARALLAAAEPLLRAELRQVSRSRARLVDAFEAERRRIERDLHDGAQERLVGLTLQLGMARLDVPQTSPAHESITTAHTQAKQLMGELRELVHGIHPRVLTDRGLPAALGALADRSALPVAVQADLPGRFPDAVEATAYFVVAEALTNVAKHSGATSATVSAWCSDGVLVVEVSDDGRGGADAARGTGLTGLADRVAVLDGRMSLSSPPGGPTLVRMELPCR